MRAHRPIGSNKWALIIGMLITGIADSATAEIAVKLSNCEPYMPSEPDSCAGGPCVTPGYGGPGALATACCAYASAIT